MEMQQRKQPATTKRVGAGLGLEKFSKAKKSAYDPRDVRDQERIRASKTIKKYRKLKERADTRDVEGHAAQVRHRRWLLYRCSDSVALKQ
jgi:hypothetical protein